MVYGMTDIMVDHMTNHIDDHYAGYMDKHIVYHTVDNMSCRLKKLAISPRSQTENDALRNATFCFLKKKKGIVRVISPLKSESSLDYGSFWKC